MGEYQSDNFKIPSRTFGRGRPYDLEIERMGCYMKDLIEVAGGSLRNLTSTKARTDDRRCAPVGELDFVLVGFRVC